MRHAISIHAKKRQNWLCLLASTTALTTLLLTVGAIGAHAAPVTDPSVVSQGEGRLLTVELLDSGIDALAALNGAQAINVDASGVVTSNLPLDLAALSTLQVAAPGGAVNVFGTGGILQLGTVGQYAAAADDAAALAFSGTVTGASSLVGVSTVTPGPDIGNPGPSTSAMINVGTTQILGGPDLVALNVRLGVVAAGATQTTAGVQSGNYMIDDLRVVVGGTLLDNTINSVNVLLDPVISAANVLLATDIINPLASGEITVDLDDLLTAAGVSSLNELAPGTNLLQYLPAAVVSTLSTTVNSLLTELSTAIASLGLAGIGVAALLATAQPAVVAILNGLSASLDGPLGTAVDALLQLDVNTKSTTVDGTFTQTALTVGVGSSGSIVRANLANASVGPQGLGPIATSLTPPSGPESGGTAVTITGSGFIGATGVAFDGTPGTSFTVNSDTQLTVTTPVHAPGLVDVTVQHPAGDSAPLGFTYTPLIAVDAIAPATGPETGGTSVTVTGVCLTGVTGLTIGGIAVPSTSFTAHSDTQIVFTAPAHAAGTVDVVLHGSVACGGDETVVDGYEYIAATAPTVSSLAPNNGPETGGTVVTIAGSGFIGATAVTFGGLTGTVFSVDSDTQITVTSPGHAPGPVGVRVLHPNGNSQPQTFTYNQLITITAVAPDEGTEHGGTSVTITGSCFTGATGVTIGGTLVPAALFTTHSDTQIVFATPAHAPGLVDVVVHGALACAGDETAPNAFEYLDTAPSSSSLTPDNGTEEGGTVVTIAGADFIGATGVTFDGLLGTSFAVDSDTQITVTTPAHAPGSVGVIVQHPAGDSVPRAYTYTPVVQVTAITPNTGAEAGGTGVTITGHCFTGATGVDFDAVAGTSFAVVNDTTITVVTPPGTPGLVDVVIHGSVACGGDETVVDGFEYIAAIAPTVTSLVPNNGPETGGTVVVITGSGFTGATGVTFDGLAGSAFTVNDDQRITVTSPAHAPGLVGVRVLHPNGNSAPANYVYMPVTSIHDIDPGQGPEEGGTTVTITGYCFTGATAVLFGTTPARSFTVVNDTSIIAVSPPGSGLADVTVVGSSACGSGTVIDGFVYSSARLASSGTDTVPMMLLGLALLLAGGALTLVRRRPSN